MVLSAGDAGVRRTDDIPLIVPNVVEHLLRQRAGRARHEGELDISQQVAIGDIPTIRIAAHPAGAMVGFLDGHVLLLTKQTASYIAKRLAIRDDGGVIPDF